jgi:endonuclease YncB( thermonuclease family)
VLILPQEENRYGRTLVELVLSVDPKSDASIPDILISAQEELLKTGNARVDEQYSSHCPGIHSFREAQAMAQKQKLGIWSYNSIPPLQY